MAESDPNRAYSNVLRQSDARASAGWRWVSLLGVSPINGQAILVKCLLLIRLCLLFWMVLEDQHARN